MRKLMYRVVFPLELKLSNVLHESEGVDALYTLFAVVVHVGAGPHHGGCGVLAAGCSAEDGDLCLGEGGAAPQRVA